MIHMIETWMFLQDAYDDVVKFFGEGAKTMPPSVFFPVFVRFIKSYRVSFYTISALPSGSHRAQI